MGVVVNLDFGLVLVEAMQAAHVLLERTFPRNRRDKEKCVQPRVVKSLSQVASGSDRRVFLRYSPYRHKARTVEL